MFLLYLTRQGHYQMFPEAVVGVLHIVFFLLPEARVDAFLLSVYGSDRPQTIRQEEAELQE